MYGRNNYYNNGNTNYNAPTRYAGNNNNNWQGGGNQWQQQQNSSYNNSQSYNDQSQRGGRGSSWQEPAPQPSRNPVRRTVAPQPQQQQQPIRKAAAPTTRSARQIQYPPAVSEDESEYFSSGIRPATKTSIKRIPTTSSFSSAESALCLVPQTPHITEITRLLKGDKGDPGQPGDSFFENNGDEIKLNRGKDLVIPGNLKVSTFEVTHQKGPLILCAGEGITGDQGTLTIQLSRDLRGQWTKDNTKIFFTPRQSCTGLFLPPEGLEPEHNQFTVHSADKQRIAFDWVMIRV